MPVYALLDFFIGLLCPLSTSQVQVGVLSNVELQSQHWVYLLLEAWPSQGSFAGALGPAWSYKTNKKRAF